MIRVIIKDDFIQIHYTNQNKKQNIINYEYDYIGIDRGQTEVLADSEGIKYGLEYGKIQNDFIDKLTKTGKVRNKLWQIAKKSCDAKRYRIIKNNLGFKKKNNKLEKYKELIKNIVFKSANTITRKAKNIILEDLTKQFSKKNKGKKLNNLLNQWTKGYLITALNKYTSLRCSELHYINAAYTSQMDSKTGLLHGKRVGDKFYHTNGEISDADINAACNIRQRYFDKEITLYTKWQSVKKILLNRLHVSDELINNN